MRSSKYPKPPFKLGDRLAAYVTFSKAADTQALKVMIESEQAHIPPSTLEKVFVLHIATYRPTDLGDHCVYSFIGADTL